MDWVLEHFRLIILLGSAIAYWLAQRKKAKEDQEIKDVLSTPDPREQAYAEAERVKGVQEEIRRKILERMSGTAKPAMTPPPLKAAPQAAERMQPKVESYEKSQAAEEALVAADQAMLERQQQLAAKLRELQQQRRAIERPSEVFAENTALAMSASDTAVRGSLLSDLRNPISARRAMVLREVLGTPVGLR